MRISRKRSTSRRLLNFSEVIRLDSARTAPAYSNRAVSYLEKGEYSKAIADCDAAIRLAPKDAPYYYNRGWLYKTKGDVDKATADYTEAIRLDPNLALAYVHRGHCYFEKAKYDKAIVDYTKAIRLDANNQEAYIQRGMAHDLSGRPDEAIADFTEAIRIAPITPWPTAIAATPIVTPANSSKPSPITPKRSGSTRPIPFAMPRRPDIPSRRPS